MSVTLSPVGGAAAQFFDDNGEPLSGGKLYSYSAGTTTPQTTYTSSSGAVAHTNPIILDAAGRVSSGGEIWLTNGVTYKFVLKTSTDTSIATWDNISGGNVSPNASDVAYNPPFTNATSTTVAAKLAQTVSAADFGAVADGVTDNAIALNNALSYLSSVGGGTLMLGIGTYIIDDTLLLPSFCILQGTGERSTILKLKGSTNKNIMQAYGGSATGVGIYDLTVDGNQSQNSAGGIYLVGTTGFRGPTYQIERCTFTRIRTAIYGAGNRGAVSLASSDWCVMRDCDFINNDYAQIALYWGVADSVIDGIYIGTNGRSSGTTSYGLWLSSAGNFFTNCYFGGTQFGPQVRLYDASANKFTSCIFDNAGTTGVEIAGTSTFNQFIGGQIGNSSYSDGGTYYTVDNSVQNSYNMFVGVTFYANYAAAKAQYGYYEGPGVDGKAILIGCQFSGTWAVAPVGLPTGSTTRLLGCQGYDTSTVTKLLATSQVDVAGAYTNAAPSTSSLPLGRFSNGAISIWMASKGYDYAWMQAIQDDGSNNLKNLYLQPLGGAVVVGGNGGGITVTSPNGSITRTISIDNSGNVVAV